MQEQDILDHVKSEIAEALGFAPAEISGTQSLVTDLGAESIDLVDLTFRLEKRFNINIPDGTLFEDSSRPVESWTVNQTAQFIMQCLQ